MKKYFTFLPTMLVAATNTMASIHQKNHCHHIGLFSIILSLLGVMEASAATSQFGDLEKSSSYTFEHNAAKHYIKYRFPISANPTGSNQVYVDNIQLLAETESGESLTFKYIVSSYNPYTLKSYTSTLLGKLVNTDGDICVYTGFDNTEKVGDTEYLTLYWYYPNVNANDEIISALTPKIEVVLRDPTTSTTSNLLKFSGSQYWVTPLSYTKPILENVSHDDATPGHWRAEWKTFEEEAPTTLTAVSALGQSVSVTTTTTGTTSAGEISFPINKKEESIYLRYSLPGWSDYVDGVRLSDPMTVKYNYPTNVVATDSINGNTYLSWSWEADNLHFADNFVVERDTVVDFSNPVKVGSVAVSENQSEYGVLDQTGVLNRNGMLYYRIYRSTTPEWLPDSPTSIVKTMAHVDLATAQVEQYDWDADIPKARLSWTFEEVTTDKVFTDGTTILVTREERKNGSITRTTFTISAEDVLKGYYLDELLTMYVEYRYSLAVQPGSTAYSALESISATYDNDYPILPLTEVKIITIEASKGYYMDYTTIDWETDGKEATYYSVQRRRYDASFGKEDNWTTLQNITASTQSRYTYSDANCLPTTLYEYRIMAGMEYEEHKFYSYSEVTRGFRRPTGTVYGRITFESGQGVPAVDVQATLAEGEALQAKAFMLDGSSTLTVNDSTMLNGAEVVSLQAWICPTQQSALNDSAQIISKGDSLKLGYGQGHLYLKVGDNILTDSLSLSHWLQASSYIHLSVVATQEQAQLFVNGELAASLNIKESWVPKENKHIIIGKGFTGAIDEVRIWNRALTSEEIAENYTLYLTGNEAGLIGYYTFDNGPDDEFYDTSYTGEAYHSHHGTATGAYLTTESVPTPAQLGYRDTTSTDGSYTLSGLPYAGNGTTYCITPTMGNHSFQSTQELRLLSSTSSSHTVNFTDMSSFDVSGRVLYAGGNVPVQGVQFLIDGLAATDSHNNVITTDATGAFTISVAVGQHEVKASLSNHTFANDGRITDSNGADRDYQDIVTGIELEDITTVKVIGRVAGGTVQEALDLGHSLSTNNLGSAVRVEFNYTNDLYSLASETREDTVYHYQHSAADPLRSTRSVTSGRTVTVYPDIATGEFETYLIPESFNVSVSAPGYGNNTSSLGGEIDLSSSFAEQTIDHTYADGTTGSVTYQKSLNYSVRVSPEITVKQIVDSVAVAWFGDLTANVTIADGSSQSLQLYDEDTDTYLLGRPLFSTDGEYTFSALVSEIYNYYDAEGQLVSDHESQSVPCSDVTVTYTCDFTESSAPVEVSADTDGVAEFSVICASPNVTTPTGTLSISAKVGSDGTTFSWDKSILKNVITQGARSKGTNYVTAGPDQIIAVLRDPPGSKSYSYLEQGTTIKFNATTTAREVDVTTVGGGVKFDVVTEVFLGLGAGSINKPLEVINSTLGGTTYTRTNKKDNTTEHTFVTGARYETSDDPQYVGADGDLYIGSATNTIFGAAQSVALITRDRYEALGGEASEFYNAYSGLLPDDCGIELVNHEAIAIGQSFETLFLYPQIYIEETLIPNLTTIRNSLLHQESEDTEAGFQALADATSARVYVSKLDPSDPNYGRSNNDSIFTTQAASAHDGPSYRIYCPANETETVKETGYAPTDSITYLNEQIAGWISTMADNEKEKVKASLLQNYSFQSGGDIEYTDTYTRTSGNTRTYTYNTEGYFTEDFATLVFGVGATVQLETRWTDETETYYSTESGATRNIGFVLAEDSNTDYLSVDVCYTGFNNYSLNGIRGTSYSGFVFRTRGGATSCPYEDAYYTKYYEPGTLLSEATVQVEVPSITVEDNFVYNVPTGESAYLTLYLCNNSDANADRYYDLKLVDGTNPDGLNLILDGAGIGNGRTIFVPAGETVTKTLQCRKASALNYDDVRLMLVSQCQNDASTWVKVMADTVSFSVHFVPSATAVGIKSPTDNWTYNTKLPTTKVNGIEQHYMNVTLDNFDINYDNFYRIMLQYKPSSANDEEWVTLTSWYADEALYAEAVENGQSALLIEDETNGELSYQLYFDDMPDQKYDLRAVGTSMINNQEVTNPSDTYSGIKDMYCPRLFGQPQPINGILTIEDEVKLTFNEAIADGYLISDNFQVTGIRNGATSDHDVSVTLDGENDYLTTELSRNFTDKDITVELWACAPAMKAATYFSHGDSNEKMTLGITDDGKFTVTIDSTTITSQRALVFEADSTSKQTLDFEANEWAHVAMVYEAEGYVSVYYNYTAFINRSQVPAYKGSGPLVFGAEVDGTAPYFCGKMDNIRVWDTALTSARLQTNSLVTLSGNEVNLMAYYPIDETRGTVLTDRAHSLNLTLQGAEWSMPDGKALSLDGENYLRISTGETAVIDSSSDFTIEMWMKGQESANADAVLLSNGMGDGNDMYGSTDKFCLGFEQGVLTFRNNGMVAAADAKLLDNDWHHLAIAVSRTNGRGQIYVDGNLDSYFSAEGIGSISADYAYVGALSYVQVDSLNTDSLVTVVDRKFTGTIDELRLWNLYKNETLVQEGMSTELDGSEKGLKFYYPFQAYAEWQGTQELQFSLADARQVSSKTDQAPDGVVVGADGSTNAAAPVKSKGSVSNLSFDFVVNTDALIITLQEDLNRIENTTVTFTVDGVRDLNGNEMVNPVTWTAYIDQNQLRWGDSTFSVVAPEGTGATFETSIVNMGGYQLNYTIENLPTWLSASSTSGKLSPAATKDITFEVSPSLAIGTYDQEIYLRGDNEVTETLALTVKVTGTAPDWSVNPSDYRYSMSVFGKLRIDGKWTNDTEDLLAAFSGSTCVGVVNNTYSAVNDMSYALLTIYSNKKEGDNLEFKIWDASTGTIYRAEPNQKVTFANDQVLGTVNDPVIFDSGDLLEQQIALTAGWNWISINVADPSMTSLNDVLADYAWADGDQIKSEAEMTFADYAAEQELWAGTLASLSNSTMYHIKSASAKTLDFDGTLVDAASTPLEIKGASWNYIPYLPQSTLSVSEALAGYEASVNDVIKSQTQFAQYAGNLGWIGSLESMESGKGYMLHRVDATDATLTYPAGNMSTSKGASALTSAAAQYSSNMTQIATVTGIDAEAGDVVALYVGGEKRGETVLAPVDDRLIGYLTIAGDESAAEIEAILWRDGQAIASAPAAGIFVANAHLGTASEPVAIDFAATEIGVYPNPIEDTLHIRLKVEQSARVDISIATLSGMLVARYPNCNQDGNVSVDWSSGASACWYIVTIYVDGKSSTYKVFKK